MGQDVNKVFLLGRIGNDLELKKSQDGHSEYVRMSIVTTERRKDKKGKWYDHKVWHSVVAFGSTARGLDTLAKRKKLRKGSRIHIEGTLDTYSWEDKKTGENKSRVTVKVIDATPIF